MDNISFTSVIRPVNMKIFHDTVAKIGRKNYVDYPWTIKEAVKAPESYTKNICDCSMLGITDGKDVLMLHLCPDNSANSNSFDIRRFIALKMDLKNPDLQAILLGSKENKKSQELYERLAGMLHDFNIPFSELKTGIGDYGINTAYSSLKDEWLITSIKIDKLIKQGNQNSLDILKNMFKKVKISQCDEVL